MEKGPIRGLVIEEEDPMYIPTISLLENEDTIQLEAGRVYRLEGKVEFGSSSSVSVRALELLTLDQSADLKARIRMHNTNLVERGEEGIPQHILELANQTHRPLFDDVHLNADQTDELMEAYSVVFGEAYPAGFMEE